MATQSNHKPLTISIATLGCKVNQYESAALALSLEIDGYNIIPFLNGDSDIFIINTCTVTAQADFQCGQIIRRAVRSNPHAVVIVTGCYAQVEPGKIANIPGVSLIAGNMEKQYIPELLKGLLNVQLHHKNENNDKEAPQNSLLTPKVIVGNTLQAEPLTFINITKFPGHTRAFLKIQDGCNAQCSYCIVPFARGRSRSLPIKEALEGIRTLCQHGYREIVLTGIHLGAYGEDLKPSVSLTGLLRAIEKREPSARIRLSSIEPLEIGDDLIDFLAQSQHVCPHVHIPLQSGNDDTLVAMGRHYTVNLFKELVEKISGRVQGASIGVDVMAGFPGENELAFERTRSFIETLPIAYLHVFPYSKRPGTEAAVFPEQVNDLEKKKRVAILRNLDQQKRHIFAEQHVGRRLSVLIEGRTDRQTGWMQGFSENYIPVLISDATSGALTNCLVMVKALEAREGKLIGRIING
jgi:threonylcarbamoyladenosine tRNA methylthiotransferase MtaB